MIFDGGRGDRDFTCHTLVDLDEATEKPNLLPTCICCVEIGPSRGTRCSVRMRGQRFPWGALILVYLGETIELSAKPLSLRLMPSQ